MNRRDILKLFGVGAVVAPVVDGVPADLVARIIQPAKIELIERAPIQAARSLQDVFFEAGICDVVVLARDPKTRQVHRMECSAFIQDIQFDTVDFMNQGMNWKHSLPKLMQSVTFKATGPVTYV